MALGYTLIMTDLIDLAEFGRILQLSVVGLLALTQAVRPAMRAQGYRARTIAEAMRIKDVSGQHDQAERDGHTATRPGESPDQRVALYQARADRSWRAGQARPRVELVPGQRHASKAG
jgi:hypothetical protein